MKRMDKEENSILVISTTHLAGIGKARTQTLPAAAEPVAVRAELIATGRFLTATGVKRHQLSIANLSG
jgi:hypothetical protein